MLIFDQLKKNDPHLRWLTVGILCGLFVLAGGLWWVQVVSVRDYQANLEMQSFRSVRMPAVRGKILDRNGAVLAENQPAYNVSLYLDEMRKDFDTAAAADLVRVRNELTRRREAQEKQLSRKLNKQELKQFTLTTKQKAELRKSSRYRVVNKLLADLSQRLHLAQPLSLNVTNFERHYNESLALPFPVLTNVTPAQIALFQEQCGSWKGVDLEMLSTRIYPHQSAAGHLLGSVHRDDSSVEGDEAFFSYRLPDYRGQVGIEAAYDKTLRGKAGVKSVVVNNIGYRQTENIWSAAEAGTNVVLTLDLQLQQRTERALPIYGSVTRGAAVVMDVESGDILAMASCPTIDPNDAVQGLSPAEIRRRSDSILRPEINRATQENYAPGSIFKTISGLACLEAGIDPNETVYNSGYYHLTSSRKIKDLAMPGYYNFRQALMHSSNTYFITNGLRAGIENIIRLGQQLHLGERFDLGTRQETGGKFPSQRRISSNWYIGDSANICIGQGQMAVTPLQMVIMTAAIANGGKVLWPRLVERLEPQDLPPGAEPIVTPKGQVRDELTVKARSLQIVRDAMLADVEDAGGSGSEAFLPSIRICGKTGTAQVMDENNKVLSDNTWFASFAPYEKPRYAVIVMIESGQSGGKTCAPIARNIYRAIVEREARRMTSAAFSNDKIRMTNDERNPNDEIQKSLVADLRFGNSDFIRHSSFVIRHSSGHQLTSTK